MQIIEESPHPEEGHTSRITYVAHKTHLVIFDANEAAPTVRWVLAQDHSEGAPNEMGAGLELSHEVAGSVPEINVDLVGRYRIFESIDPQTLLVGHVGCSIHALPLHAVVVLPNHVRPPFTVV